MAKIRYGFVSNSSSSSFIIGIVNSTESDIGVRFDAVNLVWDQYNHCSQYEVPRDPYSDYIEVRPIEGTNTYRMSIESFMGDIVSCEIADGEKFLFVDKHGLDGDYYFCDDDGDCDYDKVDLSFFNDEDVEQYDLIASLGGQVTYGAGRNG